MALRTALAQINVTVGDLAGNAARIAQAARDAAARGAQLLLTPELSLCGYPPEDLLLRPAFLTGCQEQLQALAAELAALPITVVVGLPLPLPTPAERGRSVQAPQCFNGAAVLQAGQVIGTYAKRELPNYQVFDERRYFVSGRDAAMPPLVFSVAGRQVGLLICEDAWLTEPAEAAKAAGADMLAVINASPFHIGKPVEREARMAATAQSVGLPLVFVHLCGGQDEVVFDGASFALNAQGAVMARAPMYEEQLLVLDENLSGSIDPLPEPEAQVWGALTTGVRDYLGKSGFPGAILGLSGGIDSALVLAIAVDAIGADKVRAVMMPSPYTADISWIDARDMAKRLGVQYDEIRIDGLFEGFNASLAPLFEGRAADTTEENLQARIRGTLLMALSNKTGRLVLTTGNKSEMATGYCTLYGDMAGGFAVIKDVAKTLVFRLARWRNQQGVLAGTGPVIPERIIERPPSAELRPDQKDEDSLPPYAVLDAILARYMEEDASVDDLLAEGFDPGHVERVTKLIKISEYKRRQAPIGIRITHRSFGRDWRYPITNRFRA